VFLSIFSTNDKAELFSFSLFCQLLSFIFSDNGNSQDKLIMSFTSTTGKTTYPFWSMCTKALHFQQAILTTDVMLIVYSHQSFTLLHLSLSVLLCSNSKQHFIHCQAYLFSKFVQAKLGSLTASSIMLFIPVTVSLLKG